MVSPIAARGAVPVFFPIDSEGLPLVAELERMDLQSVKAMLAVHYFGIPRSLREAREFCDRHRIGLIEDCAHSYFGAADGRQVGTWGDMAIASLTKFFPVPEGGCLLSAGRPLVTAGLNGQGVAAGLRQLVNTIQLGARHGHFRPLGTLLNGAFAILDLLRGRKVDAAHASRQYLIEPDPDSATPPFDVELAHRAPAPVARWIALRANRQRIVDRRRRNYRLLVECLTGVAGLRPLVPDLPEAAVPYVFPVWVERPDLSYHPLRLEGIPVFRWDILWPGVAQIQGDAGLEWSRHVFQLGCHQDLSDADIRSIARIVRRIVGGAV